MLSLSRPGRVVRRDVRAVSDLKCREVLACFGVD